MYICIHVRTYIPTYIHSHIHACIFGMLTYIHTYVYTYIHTDRQTVRRTDKQTDRQTDGQTNRQTDRQKDRSSWFRVTLSTWGSGRPGLGLFHEGKVGFTYPCGLHKTWPWTAVQTLIMEEPDSETSGSKQGS